MLTKRRPKRTAATGRPMQRGFHAKQNPWNVSDHDLLNVAKALFPNHEAVKAA